MATTRIMPLHIGKQGATDTAADKMMKVLEAEAATQKTAI